MEMLTNLSIVLFTNQSEWEQWLNLHQADLAGLWLKIAKKDSGIQSVSNTEAIDSALCYGWIDGQRQSYDGDYFLQKFTPRRPKSMWSKINREKVTQLISSGRMRPGGLAAIELAKQDGRWDQAYDSPANSKTPEDFQKALDQNPRARQFFLALNKTNLYAINWRIQTAKTAKLRQARIEKFITMLNANEKFHP